MAVWQVPLNELLDHLPPERKQNAFDQANPLYCHNLVLSSARWANEKQDRSTGYPNFMVENGMAGVMGGHFVESWDSNSERKYNWQDLPIKSLEHYGCDPADFSSPGMVKWARATNLIADSGILDTGTCAVMTGEATPSVRGSQALRVLPHANAAGFYQAMFFDIEYDELRAKNPGEDLSNLNNRFDIWGRAVFRALIVGDKWPSRWSWAFPNYQISPSGKHGAYVVLNQTYHING